MSPSPFTPFLISRWDLLLTCKNDLTKPDLFKSLPSSFLWVKSVNLLFKKMYFLCYHMTCDPLPLPISRPMEGELTVW